MTDLIYWSEGMVTGFFPNTPQGEVLWNQIVEQNEGSHKVYTIHLPQVLRQIRAAGYSVSKAKPSNVSMDDIMEELEA